LGIGSKPDESRHEGAATRLPRARNVSVPRPSSTAPRESTSAWWYAVVGAGGFVFGTLGERRPFGNDVLAHPLVVFFILIGVGLLILRVAARRPVPEILAERTLLLGCFLGAAAFLVGNWAAAHLL
jgi:hypothetical protein